MILRAGSSPVASTRRPELRRHRHVGCTTEIWGNNDIDSFQFGDASGCRPRLAHATLGDAGYIYLGSKTRVYGATT